MEAAPLAHAHVPASWPRAVGDLTSAMASGSHAVIEAGLSAAHQLLEADGAALIRWSDGFSRVVSWSGRRLTARFERRPAEGAGWLAGRPVVVASIDPRTDLVVSRSGAVGFDDSHVASLRALAELMAWAGVRPDHSQSLLRTLGARVVASLDPEEVISSVADAVALLLRAEIAGVLLQSPSGETLQMRCAVGNKTLDTAHLEVRPGQGLAGRVLTTGRPERVDDYGTDPRLGKEFLAIADQEGTCSALAVPLIRARRTEGVLCAWRRRREPFTDDDAALFEALGEVCAAAIHNAIEHSALKGALASAESERFRLEEENQNLRQRQWAAERDLRVHADLTQIAVEGGCLGDVVRVLGLLTQGWAAVLSDDGRELAACPRATSEGLTAKIRVWAATPAAAKPSTGTVTVKQDGRWWMLVTPVRAMGSPLGRLALGLSAAPTAGDRLAAEQAALVCAVFLAREEAAVAAARRLQSEFVWDLLEGRLPDAVEAGIRARHLGSGFALPARVAVVEVSGLAQRAAAEGWNAEQLERARSVVARLIRGALEDVGVRGAVLANRADLFAVVIPAAAAIDRAGARRLSGRLARVDWPPGLSASVGIGGVVDDPGAFAEGWQQARLAVSAVVAPGTAGLFEDLGVLQFLLSPTTGSDLHGFAQGQLGPLLAYDADHGTELLATLEAYLGEGCSSRKAAERLCVHHRTVSYRLQRVEQLANLNLDEPEDRFHVQLALKILGLAGRDQGDGAAR